ncbi:hypothetical protein [Kitasatospora sp. McL0602]|uniref:hypothetical protein n=1 Tax=Kitasatospora sp. McL0602 TaxID=3439530 RepID=UPI003F8C0AD1
MASASEYRVLISEFKSKDGLPPALKGELPVSSIRFRSIFSAPGSATITIPLSANPLAGLDFSLVSPWRALIHIQRGTRILWAGPLLSWNVDLSSESVMLDVLGLWGYYRRCIINRGSSRHPEGYIVSQLGQHTIARELIQEFGDRPALWDQNDVYASNGPNALSFDPAQDPGKLRDRTYIWYEWKNLGEAVEQLAGVIDGFGFRIDHSQDAETGRISNHFVFTPQTGEPTRFILEHGVNCDVTSLTSDGDQMCTEPSMNGQGEGWGQLKTWWYNWGLEGDADRRIPRLAVVETHNSVSRPETLAAHAWRTAAVGQTPMVIPDVRLHPNGDVTPANLRVGHIVRVRIAVPNWPSLDADYVVDEIDVSVSGTGEETTLALVPLEIYKRVEGLEPGDGSPTEEPE